MSELTKPKIIADRREKNSLVIAELFELGLDVELKHLLVADYLAGEIAVERKTINDFVSSMLSKRLMMQLIELKQNYPKQLLIIEGIEEQDLYVSHLHPNLHPNSIRGMILSVETDFGIPILFTKDYKDTAIFLKLLATKQPKPISLIAKKHAFNVSEQQQMIIESFPGIGPTMAKALLKKFKTIKAIINASEEQLKKIPRLGKKAAVMKKLTDAWYR